MACLKPVCREAFSPRFLTCKTAGASAWVVMKRRTLLHKPSRGDNVCYASFVWITCFVVTWLTAKGIVSFWILRKDEGWVWVSPCVALPLFPLLIPLRLMSSLEMSLVIVNFKLCEAAAFITVNLNLVGEVIFVMRHYWWLPRKMDGYSMCL